MTQYAVCELAFSASAPHANPYTDVALWATFTGPNGVPLVVPGFWDGENTWRVRWTPTAPGEWRYVTGCANDAGLDGNTGTLTIGAPLPGARGFLRRDPNYPAHFVFDNGVHCFLWGQTYYELLQNARAGERWKAAVDGTAQAGMNKIRLLTFPGWDDTAKTPFPETSPFAGGDHDRLDLEHWRTLDTVVGYLGEKSVLADLIPFTNADTVFGSEAQDARYLRYLLARYAAFPHVVWCLTNEWNYTKKPRDYWSRLGQIARREDPWGGRLLSIHQQTRRDWQFGDQDWPTHVIVQVGVRNGQRAQKNEWDDSESPTLGRIREADVWGNDSIRFNAPFGLPVVNDEYGYIGEPDDKSEPAGADGNYPAFTPRKHRQTIWGIALAGGYGAAGDKNRYPEIGSPYYSGEWHDTPEYGDIRRLTAFFQSLPFWTMRACQELKTAGGERVYVLANPGEQYVVYAADGGSFGLHVAPGEYAARRFDPRTGASTALGDIGGGGAPASFTLPSGEDGVVFLSRVRPVGEPGAPRR